MLMFLTILLVSFGVLAVMAVLVAGLSPREEEQPALQPELVLPVEPPKFFAPEVELPATRPPVPMEVLLAHIERHVRLEQEAARTFLAVPTSESLHSRTESPLVVN